MTRKEEFPAFEEAEEAARFWNEHSPLDFDDLEVVDVAYQRLHADS